MKIITQYLKKNSYKNVIRVFVLLVFSFVYSSTTVNAQTYCTPSYWDGCLWDDDLNSFILTGHGASVLSEEDANLLSLKLKSIMEQLLK